MRILTAFDTSGSISFSRNVAYLSDNASYSKLRLNAWSPSFVPGFRPGVTKTPTVTGIAPSWIRLSNTVVARHWPFGSWYHWPSWKIMTAAGGPSAEYWAGTYTQ